MLSASLSENISRKFVSMFKSESDNFCLQNSQIRAIWHSAGWWPSITTAFYLNLCLNDFKPGVESWLLIYQWVFDYKHALRQDCYHGLVSNVVCKARAPLLCVSITPIRRYHPSPRSYNGPLIQMRALICHSTVKAVPFQKEGVWKPRNP